MLKAVWQRCRAVTLVTVQSFCTFVPRALCVTDWALATVQVDVASASKPRPSCSWVPSPTAPRLIVDRPVPEIARGAHSGAASSFSARPRGRMLRCPLEAGWDRAESQLPPHGPGSGGCCQASAAPAAGAETGWDGCPLARPHPPRFHIRNTLSRGRVTSRSNGVTRRWKGAPSLPAGMTTPRACPPCSGTRGARGDGTTPRSAPRDATPRPSCHGER